MFVERDDNPFMISVPGHNNEFQLPPWHVEKLLCIVFSSKAPIYMANFFLELYEFFKNLLI